MRKIIVVLTIFLTVSINSFGASLKSVINAINKGDLELAQTLARRLSADERLKLEIIIYLMEGRREKAKKLLDILKRKNRKYLFNTIYRENGKYVIVVSKGRQELKIIEFFFDYPVVKRTFHITTGENAGDKWLLGDKKTPNGVYYPLYFKTGLPKVYGSGAFPLNYPNVLDKFLFKKTGGGIWLHSSDRKYYISKYSSRGCVITTEPDFQRIKEFVKLKDTPIVIVPDYEYIDKETYDKYRRRLTDFYKNWISYLKEAIKGHEFNFLFLYSPFFVSEKGGKFTYLKDFLNSIRNDTNPKFSTSDLTILKYARIPFYGDIFVVSFIFDYKSDEKNYKVRKILYIKEYPDGFKIIGEENLKIE
jgi:murein L,D-transpeptidase YafK